MAQIIGLERLLRQVSGQEYQIKAVVNAKGMVFGPVSSQHRFLVGEGIRYADDGRADGMAGMVYNGKFELRMRPMWNDASVRRLFDVLAPIVLREVEGCVAEGGADPAVLMALAAYHVVYGQKDVGAFAPTDRRQRF